MQEKQAGKRAWLKAIQPETAELDENPHFLDSQTNTLPTTLLGLPAPTTTGLLPSPGS